jgi:uncharacterized protein (TIGR03083 family)
MADVALMPLSVTDTRHLFRPASAEMLTLLRGLDAEDWLRPTLAPAWRVRDVAAHVLDGILRRLSFHRDRHPPPTPSRPIATDRAFVEFINDLNQRWVDVSVRLSPRILTDLLSLATTALADFVEQTPLESPGLFPVSWAGEERPSAAWLDIGRDFTELWHHQAQIRLATRNDASPDPRYLRAVLEIAIRGLPHSYRHLTASKGTTVAFVVSGASGGAWTLRRESQSWTIWQGTTDNARATITTSQDTAWRLLFNALAPAEAATAITVAGRSELAAPLWYARSVIVQRPEGTEMS